MDFSKFLEEEFDMKEFINNAFRVQKDPSISKDQYATTLVMKLQMFIQEVNNVIEETSQQALQNLPRVVREIEAVKQEACLLQDQMRMVKEDIEKVEQNTSQSMQMLLKLDAIKSRMKAASDALQEADNWTTLSADIEEVFQAQDVQSIATKLVGMQHSLQMLVDVPDYTERCQHLETLKNRLEAILSPQAVAAFNSQSIGAASTYVKIFTDINRLSQLYKYYHKCHKNQLLQAWKSIVETNKDDTVQEWMTEFYDQLLSTWHTQVKWCSQVFSEPHRIVSELLTETLKSMDPSLGTCISQFLEGKSQPLEVLTELKQISERFSKSIEAAFDSTGEVILGQQYLHDLASAIYAPYRIYIQKYETFETAALSRHLNKIPLDHYDVIDCVRLLGESVTKLFTAANKSNTCCLQFTNGCGYLGLLQALKTYFANYTKEFRRVLVNLREKIKTGNQSESEDWDMFQHSLRIIQTCGDLILHIEELDDTVMSSILHSVGKQQPSTPRHGDTRLKSHHPFHTYSELLLENEQDRKDLDQLVNRLEEDLPSVFEATKKDLCQLSVEVHKFAFDIVFAQLQDHLSPLATMEIWTSESAGGAITADLPTFSLSPQEYITQIGQYLLTLPQHLEPYTAQDNPALITALKHGKLPYTEEQETIEHIADLWLDSIAKGTMHMYGEEILKIPDITPHATRQLVMDVDYLCNVLDDLGLQPTDSLTTLASLLRASKEDYSTASENMPQRLVSAIAAMRKL